jgi:hypothetical protein
LSEQPAIVALGTTSRLISVIEIRCFLQGKKQLLQCYVIELCPAKSYNNDRDVNEE